MKGVMGSVYARERNVECNPGSDEIWSNKMLNDFGFELKALD